MEAQSRHSGLSVLVSVAVGLWGFWCVAASAEAAAMNIDAQVSVSFSGLRLNRTTGTFDTVASLKNTSGMPIAAPVSLVITQITSSSVTVANAAGQMPTGEPFIPVPVPAGGLAAGATVGNIVVKFRNPASAQFTFAHHVFGAVPTGTPVVTITAPANLSYVNISPTTVTGTVEGPAATVTVNAISAAVVNGRFSMAVPLAEGPNLITATASAPAGAVGVHSIQVTLDTTPPRVTITSPTDQFVTTESAITVAGIVNDIVVGTVNDQQARVTVNGAPAQVANRTFLATDVPLSMGSNVIQAVGRDRVGNAATTQITVIRQAPGPQAQLRLVSGNHQSGMIGSLLPAPLAVALTDATGNPVPNKPVIFKVTQNDGMVAAGGPPAPSAITMTNAQGQAQAQWTLGARAGAGANAVEAYAVGFAGTAMFAANGTQGPAGMIVVDTGNDQIGVVNQPLPLPLLAVVVDSGHNRLAGVPVTFTVVEGGGNFAGQPSFTVNTDSDGRAAATLTLGPQEGHANNLVEATFPGAHWLIL